MNDIQIQIFMEIYSCHSFTKAGNNLYLPEQSISRYMRDLETELGVPLWIRDKKQVIPTEYGEKFYLIHKQFEDEKEQIRIYQDIRSQRNDLKITIGFESHVDPFGILNEGIHSFKVANPDVLLSGIQTTAKEIIELLGNEIDVAIMPYQAILTQKGNFSMYKLYDEKMILLEPDKEAENTAFQLDQARISLDAYRDDYITHHKISEFNIGKKRFARSVGADSFYEEMSHGRFYTPLYEKTEKAYYSSCARPFTATENTESIYCIHPLDKDIPIVTYFAHAISEFYD